MATIVRGNVPRKTRDQIRRISAKTHPPRTAHMSANVRTWKAKRAKWNEAQETPAIPHGKRDRVFDKPSREIVKHRRRVRRARIVG